MNVPDLTREAVLSGHDFTVHDNAAADTGSERNENRIRRTFAAAAPSLTERSDIGIVADLNANTAEQLREFPRRVHLPPIQVDAYFHIAGRLHRARNPESHTDELRLAVKTLFRHRLNALCNVRQHMASVITRIGRKIPFLDERSVFPKHSQLDAGSADIYANANLLHISSPPLTLVLLL